MSNYSMLLPLGIVCFEEKDDIMKFLANYSTSVTEIVSRTPEPVLAGGGGVRF